MRIFYLSESVVMFTPSKPHWVLFILVALNRVESIASFKLHPDEVVAIKSIKTTLGANSSTWPTGDPCEFPNRTILGCDNGSVTCDCTIYGNGTCHITRLCLKGLSFPGSLPPELANLAHLNSVQEQAHNILSLHLHQLSVATKLCVTQRSDLTRNCLTGSIPLQWASLKNLNSIALTANLLSGNIPKGLSKFSSLTKLDIEANQFNGTIPDELGSMVSLTWLVLSSNQLEGPLPETFAQLTKLTRFSASDNKLNGTIPDFIGHWSNLTRLELYASGLDGPIPAAIFNLNLTDLRITDANGSESNIPKVPVNMDTLILRSVNLIGPIPKEIWKVKKLVDLTFNKLEINLSDDTPSTKNLYLSGNDLYGDISNGFSQTKNYVDLSYNNLSWQSDCQENLKINTYRSSSFKGNMSRLLPCSDDVPHNCPEGERHDSFHINCGGEEVKVTNQHGHLLYDADQDNGGPAKSDVKDGRHWGFSSTGNYLDDDQNDEFILQNTSALLMANAELYTSARRSPLSLTYFGYCLKNGNYNVHLHFAEIQFTEEKGYMKVGRRLFDIYVQGKLERKDFDIRKEASGSGKSHILMVNNTMVHDGTLEIRLYWAGKGTTCVPSRGNYGPIISAISVCSSLKEYCEVKSRSKVPLIAGIGVSATCLIFLVMGIVCWKYFFQDRYIRRRDLQGLDLQTGAFTLRQLKAATRNFDPMNKLGEGGFGAVYKGELADGTFIAVKQLSSKSNQGNREFVNEIGMISGLLHLNLVKLYGCCIEGSSLLLVYEYMENNCLAHLLFAKNSEEQSGLTLDWQTRVKICVGVATGLAFLHEGSTLRIVHRDIKATNVLLDKDMNAKISDFGLAKLNEEENTHISTRVAGTIGYMAPEYALWGYLTDKVDVYAFGVVALEIVSGKSISTYKPEDEFVCLLDWAFVLQKKGNIMEIVDPRLGTNFDEKEAAKMIKVGLSCTNAAPSLRPTMSEVVSMLEGQSAVKELESDISIYGDALQFKPLNGNFQQPKDFMSGSSQAPTTSSTFGEEPTTSSTFGEDLYPSYI